MSASLCPRPARRPRTAQRDGFDRIFTSPSLIAPAHHFPAHTQVESVPARPLFSELGSGGYPWCSRDWCSLDRIGRNMVSLGV